MLPNEQTTRSDVVTRPGDVEALVAAPGRGVARPMVDFLKAQRINAQLVLDADSAFEEALLHRPNVVLIDDRLPPAGGIELCQRLKSNTRTHFVPAILFSSSDTSQQRLRALEAGADAIFLPSTNEQERRTRLWALLRTEAIYRRQDRKHKTQDTVSLDRRRWIGNFVHDLQSSMGALQANFEYLVQTARSGGHGLQPELEECIRDSRSVFGEMARGFRTVLDFERFESGRISLREGRMSLYELAEEAAAEVEWQARSMGKLIEVVDPGRQLAGGADAGSVMADHDLLKQVAVNLIGYALRLPGSRHVTLRPEAADGVSRLRVFCDGDGISPIDRDRVFEPYARVSKQAPVGHGLGLALAKVVVELHGGSIWVEDGSEGGACFVVELKSDGSVPNRRPVE